MCSFISIYESLKNPLVSAQTGRPVRRKAILVRAFVKTIHDSLLNNIRESVARLPSSERAE